MKIIDLVENGSIKLNLESTSKDAVIEELANELLKNEAINDIDLFIKDIKLREAQSSTAIGEGIAIPHAKSKAVIKPSIVFSKNINGVDYDSLDGAPSHLFFMIAAPHGELELHLQALSKLARKLIYPEVKEALLKSQSIEEIKNIFKEME